VAALLIISRKVELEGWHWKIGHSRYMPKDALCGIWNADVTSCFCISVARCETVNTDLW